MKIELDPAIPKLELLNKCDLLQAKARMKEGRYSLCISCHSGEGLSELRQKIHSYLLANFDMQNALLLEERQIHHLRQAHKSLEKVQQLSQEAAPDEIIALEIDQSLREVGAITMPIDNEEVLGRIFSMFCIGK